MFRPLPPAAPRALACAVVCLGSCVPADEGVPLDRPLFPLGLAVAGDHLLVTSSNFDLAEEDGAILSADLATVRARVAGESGDDVVPGGDAYTDGVIVPPFGDRPVVTSGGERAYVPTKGTNRVIVLDIAPDGTLDCAPPAVDPTDSQALSCGESTSALQLRANDPFDIVILNEARTDDGALGRVDGIVTLLSSSEIVFFSDDPARAGAGRVQIVGSLDLGDLIGGIRSAVVRPEVAGTDRTIIAAADLNRDLDFSGARLLLFAPALETELKSFDVTTLTGSLSMRDILLVPGDDGEADALVAVLRNPDALARFEIDEAGALPDVRLSVLASTCRAPTSLARARVPLPPAGAGEVVDRVLLTCQDSDAVLAVDPLTLRTTDAVRFAGRAPYDVVVHEAPDTGVVEAYVSFFLDGSVGTLAFVDGKLVHTGRIGEPLPPPETGRE